jgi:hypothetical protein
MVDYDGTDTFTGNVVTGNKLDTTAMWHGSTLPTSPTNEVPANGMFMDTDDGIIYENTGTLGSPTWTARTSASSTPAEFANATTGGATITPTAQTGNMILSVDNTKGTAGSVSINVDGTSENTVASGTITTRVLNPSTSVTVTTSTDGDVSAASYSGNVGDVSSQHPNSIHNCYVMDNGSRLFTHDENTDAIYQYTMSTAYDISTISYDSKSYDFTSQDGGMRGFWFKPDGLKVYIIGWGNRKVFQYTLSTAWDISTTSYDGTSFSVITQTSFPYNVWFKADGLKMVVCGSASYYLYPYTLSTAWDVSTASYDGNSKTYNPHAGSSPTAMRFSTDGFKLITYSNKKIRSHTLTTAFDLSTASYDSAEFDCSTEITDATGAMTIADLTKVYVCNDASLEKVMQYNLGSDFAGTVRTSNIV